MTKVFLNLSEEDKLTICKPCSKCGQEKSLSEYNEYKSGARKGRFWAEYKACRYDRLKIWREENPEAYKLHYTKSRYRYHYGLELDEIKRFGICPICLEEKKLLVDHDHNKPRGQYRDFICYSCNTLLGQIENPEKLKRIKNYLNVQYL